MNKLYPIKFKPITQYRIWGGNKLNQAVSDDLKIENLGEIWSISGVEGNISEVENGFLKGQNLNELISTYQEKLVGKKVWEKFGNEFPLLIKFIDAAQPLSVQVHPNDEQAKRLHNSFGKSEMWYIMDAEKDAELIIGFQDGVEKLDYEKHLKSETLEEILGRVSVTKGDAVYIPAGRVHAIGAGIVLAEIQQTSDVTYRIYDYNRIDKDGNKRELHTDLALEAIDFSPIENVKTKYNSTENQFETLIDSPFFKTQIFTGDQEISMTENNEMRIYICTEGSAKFQTQNGGTKLKMYETLLIPAEVDSYKIIPERNATLIEVRVP
ncbi:type I phosphomannose isomerase catalytic subunit [Moheibacter lacus]|uniref:Class I mannose-6-phosphate isomerase n=1 Tax=Moheibacter lacus TaxID=2745851 RepID=A0A838ZPG2_9FLAO|nr:type I phosphomannose isomerase catalytic subunit [Moheibacter lacus]MBA5629327.1 class I mannose-6-phosphate isomerase [Moheibacter lacus]